LEWNPQEWWTVLSGYQNVAIVLCIGFLWHFIPQKAQDKQLAFFHKIPLFGKMLLFAAVIWVISATASSEVQPFIYFQF
jgi:alginate O-acetyltransferase complex protein AlgI